MAAYDGVILGAGHNGLILQAYLGMAGLKTVALERRQIAGGGLSTMEDPRFPGFLHNTHGFFQRAITAMPWYRDLDLAARGAEYIEPELNVVLLTRGGRALEWWTDFERTATRSRTSTPKTPRHCAAGTTISCRSSRLSLPGRAAPLRCPRQSDGACLSAARWGASSWP